MRLWLALLALSGAGCITVKFEPLPVVLSWGGIQKESMEHPDAGVRTLTSSNWVLKPTDAGFFLQPE